MANTVDERIVEAKFDSSDFEKGVDKTVKKLDELKKSLNLKDSGKSIAEFAKETQEGMDKAGNALERLSDRFTTFKGMLKQQILGGLVNEISNVFVSLEQGLARFVKSISSDQIAAGMNKYNEILTAVRTMTAAGVVQDVAYEQIKRLGEYSDQTSYSLSQMTSGMSKLVAAGMTVDKAEKSMEGLANMAASAGVNIYDANRAFLNFSQAYSSGSMRIQDWMSFENLNMATESIMKIFMMAGEQVGTLTKQVGKDGEEVYKTTNKIDKAIKANKEVATSGFRDTLSFKWLNKATMEQATAVLSYFEDLGISVDELSDEQLENFAAKAFAAAKEARSFADVTGTVKDVIATGWATSFELIFGKLDEAVKFFTWLSESNLADTIYGIGEFRNAVLTAWGKTFAEGGIWKFEGEDKINTGRDAMMQALKNIDEMIGVVRRGLESILPEEFSEKLGRNMTFAEKLGYHLGVISKNFMQATSRMLDFFTVLDEEGNPVLDKDGNRILKPEYLERIQKIGTGIGSVIGVISKFSDIANKTLWKVFHTIQPIVDAIGDAVGSLLEPFTELNKNDKFFNNITNAIDNLLKVAEPAINVLAPIIRFLGELGGTLIGLAIDTAATNIEMLADALGFIIELFGGTSAQQANDGVGVIEGWTKNLEEFAATCREGLGAIKEFFEALFDDLRNLFGIGDQVGGQTGGFFENIKEFFETNKFVQNVTTWFKALPGKISKTANNLWNKIDEFLYGKKVRVKDFDGNKFTWQTMRLKSGFSKWLDTLGKNVTNWFKDLPDKAKNLWNSIDEFLFGKKVQITKPSGESHTIRIKGWFAQWLSDTVAKVKDWICGIPSKISGLWQSIVDFFFGKEVKVKEINPDTGIAEEKTTRVKEGFSKWLEDTKNSVKEWVGERKEDFKKIWTVVLDAIFGKVDTGEETKEVEEQSNGIVDSVETILEDIGPKIGALIANLPTYIAEGMTYKLGLIKDLFEHVTGYFKDKNEAKKAGDEAGEGASDLLTMTAEEAAKKVSGDEAEHPFLTALMSVGQTLGGLVTSTIPSMLTEAWTYISSESGGWWESIQNIFDIPDSATIWASVEKNAASIGIKLAGYIKQIPDTLRLAASSVAELFRAKSPLEKAQEEITRQFEEGLIDEHAYRYAMKQARDTLSDTPKESDIFEGLKEIGAAIGSVFADFGPDILNGLNTAFTWISEKVTNFTKLMNERDKSQSFFEWIETLIGGEGAEESAIAQSIKSLGETIKNIITEVIPQFIGAAFAELSVGIPKFISNLFGGSDSEAETTGEQAGEELGSNVAKSMMLGFQNMLSENSINMPKSKKGINFLEAILGVSDAEAEDATTLMDSYEMQLFGTSAKNAEKAVENATETVESMGEVLDKQTSLVNRKEKIDELYAKLWKNGIEEKKLLISLNPDQNKYNELADEDARIKQELDYLESLDSELADISSFEESGKKVEQATTGFLGAFQSLINGLGQFAQSDLAMYAVIAIAIATVIHSLKEVLSVTDEVESVGYTAKWEGIKYAVLGIVGILGWLSYLSAQPDANTAGGRLDTTLKTLDSVTKFVERIGEVIKVVAGIKVGGSIFDVIGSYFDMKSAKNAAKAAGQVGNLWSQLGVATASKGIDILALIFGSDAFGNSIEKLGESLAAVFADIGYGVENFTYFLSPAVSNLTGMSNDVLSAITTIEYIQTLIGKINELVGVVDIARNLNEDIGGVNNSNPDFKAENTAVYMSGLTNSILGVLFVLGSAMSSLSKGIEDFSKLNNPTEAIKDLTDFVGSDEFFDFISQLSSTLTNAIQTGGAHGMATIADTAIGLEMLANAMSIFTTGLSGLTTENVTALGQMLDVFERLATLIADNPGTDKSVFEKVFSGDNSLSHFGQEIQAFGGSMLSFYQKLEQLKGFSEKDVETTQKKVDSIIKVANGMAQAASTLGNFGTGDAFEILGNILPGFGSNVGAFITAVNDNLGEDVDIERIQIISSGITAVAELMKGVGSTMTGLVTPTEIPGFISQFLKGITDNFVGDNDLYTVGLTAGTNFDAGLAQGIKAGAAIAAAQALADAISGTFTVSWQIGSPSKVARQYAQYWNQGLAEGFNKGTVDPIEAANTIAKQIAEGLDFISNLSLSDTDTELKITPVVDMTNVDEALDMLGLFNQNGKITFDITGLNNNAQTANPDKYGKVNTDYSGLITGISNRLAAMSNSTTKVTADLNGAQVVMDTGAIVGAIIGEIDLRLGRSGFYSGREANA